MQGERRGPQADVCERRHIWQLIAEPALCDGRPVPAVALGDRVEAVLGVDRHLAVALVVLLRASDVVLLALGALELVAGRTELLIRLPATTL